MEIIAQPLTTLVRDNTDNWLEQIDTILTEQEVAAVVVGYPLTLKGEVSAQTREVEKFIEVLRTRIELPIHTYDERLTSQAARRSLILQGVKTGHDKGAVDRTAAAIMLQDYLDSRS